MIKNYISCPQFKMKLLDHDFREDNSEKGIIGFFLTFEEWLDRVVDRQDTSRIPDSSLSTIK